jgi:hypothetical protein
MSSKNKVPPVPQANRSPKGPGLDPEAHKQPNVEDSGENLKEQGRQGNIYQNTHNQGHQQDR